MKHYTLMRFVRLNVYFFLMYSALTAVWYGVSGKFGAGAGVAAQEIFLNAAVFSLLFSLAILIWYRRTDVRIPVRRLSARELEQKLADAGYARLHQPGQQQVQVYKPAPPKAPALAGKIFVQKSANFYHVQGPAKYVNELKD